MVSRIVEVEHDTIIPTKPSRYTPDYAGFWKRFLAYIIDLFIIILVSFAIGLAFGLLLLAAGVEPSDEYSGFFDIADIALFLFNTTLIWIYYAEMESSSTQATLGKMAVGIKVTDLHGNRIGFGKATGRHFGKIISSLILLIGYAMIAITEKKQGLHDMMAGCLVVNR